MVCNLVTLGAWHVHVVTTTKVHATTPNAQHVISTTKYNVRKPINMFVVTRCEHVNQYVWGHTTTKQMQCERPQENTIWARHPTCLRRANTQKKCQINTPIKCNGYIAGLQWRVVPRGVRRPKTVSKDVAANALVGSHQPAHHHRALNTMGAPRIWYVLVRYKCMH